MGAENLAPTAIRSPDRPVCSESLYRLCYTMSNSNGAKYQFCVDRIIQQTTAQQQYFITAQLDKELKQSALMEFLVSKVKKSLRTRMTAGTVWLRNCGCDY